MSENKGVRLVEVNVEAPGNNRVFAPFYKGARGIPYVVLVDTTGRVLATLPGYMDQDGVNQMFKPLVQR